MVVIWRPTVQYLIMLWFDFSAFGRVSFYQAREAKLFFHTITERAQLPATVTSFPVHSRTHSSNAHWENKADRQKMETERQTDTLSIRCAIRLDFVSRFHARQHNSMKEHNREHLRNTTYE